jgi:hypothetical protein
MADLEFTIEIEGLEDLERDWELAHRDLLTNVARAVTEAASDGIKAAQDSHPYTDRTYQLTETARATRAETVGNEIQAEMVWNKDYASFVTEVSDGAFDFTPEAIETAEAVLDGRVDQSIDGFAERINR